MRMEASDINVNVKDISVWMALKLVNWEQVQKTKDSSLGYSIVYRLEVWERTKWFSNKPELSFLPFFEPKTNLCDLTQLKNTN